MKDRRMYKIIPEFPRWEINENGHIRNTNTKVGKYSYVSVHGYLTSTFKSGGKTFSRKIHRIVGELFLPEPEKWLHDLCASKWPYKPCINHIDHDKLNNHVNNLEWCDINHNNQAAILAGVVPPLKGELNGMSVLTEDLVHKVCKSFEEGMKPKEAVVVFNISRQQATKIRAGYAWKHVWEQYDIKVNRRNKNTEKFNDQNGSS
jgi:hypothetical protein